MRYDTSSTESRGFRKFAYNEEERLTTTIGEKALLAAVLERAAFDLRSPDRYFRDNAYCWVFKEHSIRPWSIRWIFQELDLELALPEYRRRCQFIYDNRDTVFDFTLSSGNHAPGSPGMGALQVYFAKAG